MVTFIATHDEDANKKRKKKSFPFPLTLIRPRYYQREAIYHRRIDNGRSPKERTPTMGHKRNVRYKRVVPVLNASPPPPLFNRRFVMETPRSVLDLPLLFFNYISSIAFVTASKSGYTFVVGKYRIAGEHDFNSRKIQ